ncbi:MAG: aminoacetone oxidase family FAD-binding enzyme [Sulfurimonadaceae bacterium]|nr:aminoacetone oxidase family FAD-binding enzyme [Sulfurimonadaceae bacterium]
MSKQYDVVILGAGAGGLMCAGWLNQNSTLKVAVIEGNAKAGAKLKISGGGKCNITNVDVQSHHFLGDFDLLEAVLGMFSKEDLLEFLDLRGLKPVIRKGRYYFCEKSADEIISLLMRECKGVDFYYDHDIRGVEKSGSFRVLTDKGSFDAGQVVVATGGVSFKSVGATGIGLEIAERFGHRVIPFAPALAGLTLQNHQFWMKELTGISFPVRIEIEGRVIEEDMLFAHKGISGPAILSASLYWHKGTIEIDFLPSKSMADACRGEKKQVSTIMGLPKRFSKLFLEHIGVRDKPCSKLTEEELQLLQQLHAYRFAPAGTFGFTKAEVSKGGVSTDELNHYTMESLKCDGLYFIGEVVDVTGELGGYNFQWAFSSAVVAARNLCEGV